MIARVAVVVAALAAIVLLAGELRTARDVDRAEALSRAQGSVPGGARAPARRRGAHRGHHAAAAPGAAPALRRPGGDAIGSARAAVRREPENAQGWLLLAQAAERAGDASLGAEARRRVAALVARP